MSPSERTASALLALVVLAVIVAIGMTVYSIGKDVGYCDALGGEKHGDLCVKDDKVVHDFDK